MWKQAEKDYEAAKRNFDIKQYYLVAFLCQQAVEKALKALYIKKYKRLLKVHDLVLLARKVDAPSEIQDLCKSLNSYYIETRYPGIVWGNQ